MGGNKSLVETHYQRSREKSGGRLAGPYVSYATAVSIPAQDYATFKACLEAALALDPNADPANRLVNILAQRKARYLLDNAGLYFVDYDTGGME
jgi:predicted anti-sigma-YlaC factor YlaD